MTTFISILRGINVSGQRIIRMAALKKIYGELGFLNVTSYLQSGNIIFQTDPDKAFNLAETISNRIRDDLGIEVRVIVLTMDMIKQIIECNPFGPDPAKDSKYMHVTFLASEAGEYDAKAILSKKAENEDIMITGNVVYLYCPNGYGRTKLTNNFLEARLKVTATTRNWKTTNELLRLAATL